MENWRNSLPPVSTKYKKKMEKEKKKVMHGMVSLKINASDLYIFEQAGESFC